MKAYDHELAHARQEGVVLIERAAVVEIVRDGGDAAAGGGGAPPVTGVRLVETEDGRPTARARGEITADLVIMAIGQATLRALAEQFPDVTCDERGCIVVDPATCVTGNPRVFAGGDAVNGGKEVVNAVHDGQAAAAAMEALFRQGRSDHDDGRTRPGGHDA
jgi:glutamate synthase (NADPH/NADH) small chain